MSFFLIFFTLFFFIAGNFKIAIFSLSLATQSALQFLKNPTGILEATSCLKSTKK